MMSSLIGHLHIGEISPGNSIHRLTVLNVFTSYQGGESDSLSHLFAAIVTLRH